MALPRHAPPITAQKKRRKLELAKIVSAAPAQPKVFKESCLRSSVHFLSFERCVQQMTVVKNNAKRGFFIYLAATLF